MPDRFIQFLKGFTFFSLLIGLISGAIFFWFKKIPISSDFLYILVFMYLLTMLLISLLLKSMQNRLSRFVNAFMLLNFAKLILYTLLIFAYAWLNREGAIAFILTFFTYYILFTTYEIVFLLRMSK
jgi:hypothetical protein